MDCDFDNQICIRCVMDTSDPYIQFDNEGVCSHCKEFDEVTSALWFPNEYGEEKLKGLVAAIKAERSTSDYDCIIGLSGGVDSSYLAIILKKFGLRALAVHVDAGWNSELAVHNIEKVVKFCEFDLYTHVMDWQEIQDLQLAYFKSGVANQDVVQDHAFFASLYRFAVKHKIRHVMSGGNIATESVEPVAWEHTAMDSINLRAIHRRFGRKRLKNYRTISLFEYYFYFPFIRKMVVSRPLNFLPYNKSKALETLKKTVDYKPYGRKHSESRFTRFYQDHYLPTKFRIDKRRSHNSSLILSGEITREQALSDLSEPLYDPVQLSEDKLYISKKLGISLKEFNQYLSEPGRSYRDYSNWDKQHQTLKKIQSFFQQRLNLNLRKYS